MKLIVGLGNPGRKFAKTRHNLGFLAVDALASKFRFWSRQRRGSSAAAWFQDLKFKSKILKINERGTLNQKLIFVKPQTFVNSSGVAVKKIVDFYKLAPTDILVIRDDIDLEKGKIRGPVAKTGSGGHLGVASIINYLGINEFYQLKIGLGRPPEGQDPADFVLKPLTNGEWNYFRNLLTDAKKTSFLAKVEQWILNEF